MRSVIVRGLKALCISGVITFTFLGIHYWDMVVFLLIFGIMLRIEYGAERKHRKQVLMDEFGEMMLQMSALLQAGHPIEHVFGDTALHLKQVYGGKSLLCENVRIIDAKLSMNIPVETALQEFADTYGLEKMDDFAKMVSYVKRTSGDLGKIMSDTAGQISHYQRTENEIWTIISGKYKEFEIMCLTPVLMLLMVRYTAYSFVSVLYESTWGQLFLLGCLLFYLLMWWWGRSLVRIEV